MPDKVKDEIINVFEKKLTSDEPNKQDEAKSKPKYPKIVILFLVFIIFEVFSGGGFRTVLMIYMKNFILLSDNTATAVYHTYVTLSNFTPILGAIIADAYLGPYKTIKYSLFIVITADIVLTITSVKPLTRSNLPGLAIALILKAIAAGGLGPCLGTFGANQFNSEQKKYVETYFSVFYLSINIASSVSSIVLPMLRNDFKCYGQDCYPLAYGVATIVLVISFVIFMLGSPFYRKNINDDNANNNARNGNVFTQTIGCIYTALKNFFRRNKNETKEHWLDYADNKYTKEIKNDIKTLLRVIVVFLPLPIFWALYDQQYSRWILQAQQLNGIIGSYTIKPDQLQSVNPILIVILVPLFDFVIYPLFSKIGLLKRQLQRIGLGLLFTILSFGVAAILEWQMQVKSLENNPIDQIKILNLSPCNLTLLENNSSIVLNNPNYLNNAPYLFPTNHMNNQTVFEVLSSCKNTTIRITHDGLPQVLLFYSNELNQLDYLSYKYDVSNQEVGFSQIQIYSLNLKSINNIKALLKNKIETISNVKILPMNTNSNSSIQSFNYSKIDYSNYIFKVIDKVSKVDLLKKDILLESCARYTIILFENSNKQLDYVKLTDIHPNGLHISLQLLQIFIMGVAEILVSISGLTFSYEEAPTSMKSIVQALWILTISVGNLVVVIIAESKFVSNQVHEYLIFMALLALATGLFFVVAFFYKYVEKPKKEEETMPSLAKDLEKDAFSKEIEAM